MFKISILGPESTGKSALAKSLSEHFNSPWVPEYAREYVEKLTLPYTYNDVCNIALKQIEEENFYNNKFDFNHKYVFFDTDLIITKVWFEYCYQKVPDFLIEQLNKKTFDFYLLCYPDLPWEADTVREHGHDREFFFNWYKSEIERIGKPYLIITGIGNVRIQNAINGIQNQQNLKFSY
jgi:NadR type nicotinamide-nucleotide adenylyltransferase